MRILNSFKTGLLAAALLVAGASGCGTSNAAEGDLDLSRLPIIKEGEGAVVWARPATEAVNCVRAPCPSNMIYEVNTGETVLVYAYDWRALNLSMDQQSKLQADPSRLLLGGRYAVLTLDDQPLKVFQVLRANQRIGTSSDTPPTDKYYAIHMTDPSCQQQPCPVSAVQLNREFDQAQQWSGIDWNQIELSFEEQQSLITQLKQGDAYVSTRDVTRMPVIINSAFLPFVVNINLPR